MDMDVLVEKSEIEGTTSPPPSKSYTHRALLASALSPSSEVLNPLIADDTLATLRSCVKMGAMAIRRGDGFVVRGTEDVRGGYFYMANSGTTLRLFLGILSLPRSFCFGWGRVFEEEA